ncbi:MAG: cysteine--tRNA ligase [Actinobacteria bacterium]|uniref:Cysteine--tRNA ligase n=1 Tax=freshwater metagenome TaxID=449393 RepID=A0A6J6P743_9ZZZZ|nr:cysteine--tRNA ligase [Actinomycetota bacterium]
MITTEIKLFDTKSRELQPLVISNDKKLRVYSCGPTVYRDAHVGNMRTFLLGDLIMRLVKFTGYQVEFIQNITDVGHMSEDFVEDKMLAQAKAESKDPFEIARIYEKRFHEDLRRLNIEPANSYPKASECINLMQELIQKLIETDHAYLGTDNCVYFSAQSFPGYGAISGNRLDALKPGHRFEYTEDGAKRFHADWALWKAAGDRTEMIWDSPWGKGFPGWHIECSAMSLHYLDKFVDLHLGGIDLRFPHHENERAQSNAAINKEAVALWIHGDHLLFESRKMSKSAGNVVLVSDLIDKHLDPLSLRVCFLENRYRSQMDLSWESLKAAHILIQRWREKIIIWQQDIQSDSNQVKNLVDEIVLDFSQDLDTPRAIQNLRVIEKDDSISNGVKYEVFKAVDPLFGLDLFKSVLKAELPDDLAQLLAARQVARDSKNFKESDRLRDLLAQKGIEVKDNKAGQEWDWQL